MTTPRTHGTIASRHTAGERRSRGAFVLVAILVLVMLLSMVVVTLLFRFRAEDTASSASASSEQAWAAALSGVQEAIRIATQAAPGATDWQDNPAAFRARLIFADGVDQWRFTVYSPAESESLQELRFGLTDEAGKLNVNLATAEELGRLPRLNPALAEAVADFIDADDSPQPNGAEQEYYSALPRPYLIRNGPLETLDELLLVRGFTPALLYGKDAALANPPPTEAGADATVPSVADGGGRPDFGLRQWLTVATYDVNVSSSNQPRTHLNDPEGGLPPVELPAALTNYLAALRTNNFFLLHAADLLDTKLVLPSAAGAAVEVPSGVGKAELPTVIDWFTTTTDSREEGLVNINTASVPVLATLPGIDEPLAEAIVSMRQSIGAERRTTIAWLHQEGVLDAEKFKLIAPWITVRSRQFSFRVIGYGVPSGRFRLFDVRIDTAGDDPRVTYLREITRLGLPFKLELDAMETSRSAVPGRRATQLKSAEAPRG